MYFTGSVISGLFVKTNACAEMCRLDWLSTVTASFAPPGQHPELCSGRRVHLRPLLVSILGREATSMWITYSSMSRLLCRGTRYLGKRRGLSSCASNLFSGQCSHCVGLIFTGRGECWQCVQSRSRLLSQPLVNRNGNAFVLTRSLNFWYETHPLYLVDCQRLNLGIDQDSLTRMSLQHLSRHPPLKIDQAYPAPHWDRVVCSDERETCATSCHDGGKCMFVWRTLHNISWYSLNRIYQGFLVEHFGHHCLLTSRLFMWVVLTVVTFLIACACAMWPASPSTIATSTPTGMPIGI